MGVGLPDHPQQEHQATDLCRSFRWTRQFLQHFDVLFPDLLDPSIEDFVPVVNIAVTHPSDLLGGQHMLAAGRHDRHRIVGAVRHPAFLEDAGSSLRDRHGIDAGSFAACGCMRVRERFGLHAVVKHMLQPLMPSVRIALADMRYEVGRQDVASVRDMHRDMVGAPGDG